MSALEHDNHISDSYEQYTETHQSDNRYLSSIVKLDMPEQGDRPSRSQYWRLLKRSTDGLVRTLKL